MTETRQGAKSSGVLHPIFDDIVSTTKNWWLLILLLPHKPTMDFKCQSQFGYIPRPRQQPPGSLLDSM